MPRFNNIWNAFVAGEISPKAQGRTDLPAYQKGASEITNMLVQSQGGATRRMGSQYMNTAPGDSRLIPFVYSQADAYIVELSASGCRVFHEATGAVCTVTVDPSVPAILAYIYYQVQYAQSADVLYLVNNLFIPVVLKRTNTYIFTLQAYNANLINSELALSMPFRDVNIDTTITISTTAIVAATTGTFTASKPLFDLNHVGAIFRLTNGSTTGVFLITSYSSGTSVGVRCLVDISSGSASSQWQESAWSDFRGWPRAVTFFESRLYMGGNTAQPDTFWGSQTSNYGHMTPVAGATVTNADALALTLSSQELNPIQWMSGGKTLSLGTLGAEYILEGSDPNSSFGPLNAGQLLQSAHGSAAIQPRRVGYTLLFVQRALKKLYEFVFEFTSDSYVSEELSIWADHMSLKLNPILPATSGMKQIDWDESRNTLWCVDNAGGLFTLSRQKQQGVSAWTYQALGGAYPSLVTNTLTGFLNTTSGSGAVLGGSTHFTTEYSVGDQIFCRNEVRTVLSITDDTHMTTDAWTQTLTGIPFGEFAKVSTSSPRAPYINSIAIVPNADGSDHVWVNVSRYFKNGKLSTYNEKITKDFELPNIGSYDPNFALGPYYSDSCAVLNVPGEAAQTTFSAALPWLSNQVVTVLADGKVHPPVTVGPTGDLTLSYAASYVIAGLPYSSWIKTLRCDSGAAIGSAQGAIKRIDRAVIRFFNTIGAKFGYDPGKLETLNFRSPTQTQNSVLPLFTGDKVVTFPGDFDRDNYVIVRQDDPLPMTVVSIVTRGITDEQ